MLLLVIKWILLIVKVSEYGIDTCDGNNIPTYAKVVTMCQGKKTVMEDEQDGSENVDSVFLSLMKQENNCSCNVTVKDLTTSAKINFKRINFSEQPYCGMEIDVYQIRQNENETVPTNDMPTKCNSTKHTQSLSLIKNEYLRFTSRVVDGNFSTGYCIQIEREDKESQVGSSLEISCGNQALSTTTDTPINAQTTFSDTLTNPKTTFGDTTTHPHASLSVTPTRTQTTINDFRTSEQVTSFMSSATPMIDKSHINDKTASDGDSTLYIAVGSGSGFVLFVSLLVVIVLCKRRKSHLSGKEENSANPRAHSTTDDDDDDGLKYNVMYVSSERHDDIDVNYSTVDGHIPRHIGGDDEGDYSTVDDNKNIQDSSLNTREFTNTDLEDKGDDGVEHRNVPTESGCVYAVVEKSRKTNNSVKNMETASTSAIYAVVDKTRVRHPDEVNK